MVDIDRDAEPGQGSVCHSTALEPCFCFVGPHNKSQMMQSAVSGTGDPRVEGDAG